MRPVRIHDVEPGRMYRFTFRRPVLPNSRSRVIEGMVGASFWGEVPLHTDQGIVRVQRDDVTRVLALH